MHTAITTTAKEQLHRLIEKMTDAQLTELLRLAESLPIEHQPVAANGVTNGTEPLVDSIVTNQGWLNAIDELNDSPHWDEFLAELADIHTEHNVY